MNGSHPKVNASVNSVTSSYLTALECSGCAASYSFSEIHTYCPECQSPLLACYNLPAVRREVDRDAIRRRPYGMWRWNELLPVQDSRNIVSLGEGDTSLLDLPKIGKELGLSNLYIKDESKNPTGSFKARGLAAAVSKAKELGIKKVIIPTAGNAGGAMAAYAARGGIQALIYMPRDTPRANIQESLIAGAEVVLVDGLISDAAGMVGEKARQDGWFDLSTFKEPYRLEGKKIMGYELAEAFDWSLPEVIIYPTGGGTGLVGMWKAFAEMEKLGWIDSKRPRMVTVQSEGCAPMVKAFNEGKEFAETWQGAKTIADGLRVPAEVGDFLIMRALRESSGTALAVPDNEMMEATNLMGRTQGIFAAPEGGATLAAFIRLLHQGWIKNNETVVLFNTGSGHKYAHLWDK
jgi:threonine synthase